MAMAAHEAAERISPMIRATPLERSAQLGTAVDAEVLLKFEHRQYTGSFKLRGATNRILSLSAEERRRGVVAPCASCYARLRHANHKIRTDPETQARTQRIMQAAYDAGDLKPRVN